MDDPYILLVEDNPDDEELTLRAFRLAQLANRVVVARDGQEALDVLFDRSDRPLPSVTLLDLNLPKVGGLEILERVRSDPRTSHLPVIILTSSRQQEDVLRSYDLRANAYVRKPVAFDEFAEAIRVLGRFWLVVNESPPARVNHAAA